MQKHTMVLSRRRIWDPSPTSFHSLQARQKPPIWVSSHSYLRGARIKSEGLRIRSCEMNMIKQRKLARPLKSKQQVLPKRKDAFIWGRKSSLAKDLV